MNSDEPQRKVSILFGRSVEEEYFTEYFGALNHQEWVVAVYANGADALADAALLNARVAGLGQLPFGDRRAAVVGRLMGYDAHAVEFTGANVPDYYVVEAGLSSARRIADA